MRLTAVLMTPALLFLAAASPAQTVYQKAHSGTVYANPTTVASVQGNLARDPGKQVPKTQATAVHALPSARQQVRQQHTVYQQPTVVHHPVQHQTVVHHHHVQPQPVVVQPTVTTCVTTRPAVVHVPVHPVVHSQHVYQQGYNHGYNHGYSHGYSHGHHDGRYSRSRVYIHRPSITVGFPIHRPSRARVFLSF